MERRGLLLALGGAAAALVSAPARRALACACCPSEGTRLEDELPLEGFYLGELHRIQLSPGALLFTTDAGMADASQGIREATETYTVTSTRTVDKRGGVWKLAFVDAKGKTGDLSWVLPKTFEHLAVDTRDGRTKPGVGPIIYNEVRLRMPVAGTGVFEPGHAPGTTARLVLQGHGTMCLSAELLSTWSLTVRGPRARYQFFGTLLQPKPRK